MSDEATVFGGVSQAGISKRTLSFLLVLKYFQSLEVLEIVCPYLYYLGHGR